MLHTYDREAEREHAGRDTDASSPTVRAGSVDPRSSIAHDARNEIRQGSLGMKLSSGEVVLTTSGRKTTPFPRIACGTNRKCTATLKRVDQWLMENAVAEAHARGDKFNRPQFERNTAKPQQADKDAAEEYLFGVQPRVLPPFCRPLTVGIPTDAQNFKAPVGG